MVEINHFSPSPKEMAGTPFASLLWYCWVVLLLKSIERLLFWQLNWWSIQRLAFCPLHFWPAYKTIPGEQFLPHTSLALPLSLILFSISKLSILKLLLAEGILLTALYSNSHYPLSPILKLSLSSVRSFPILKLPQPFSEVSLRPAPNSPSWIVV